MSEEISIRQALIDDITEIARIWRDGAEDASSRSIANLNPEDFFREKIEGQDDVFKVWVAVDSANSILGWQSLLPLTNNPIAGREIAESSTYVCTRSRQKGVAQALLAHAINHAKRTSLRYIAAFITENNEKILELAKKMGVQCIGTLPASPKSTNSVKIHFVVYVVPLLQNSDCE